MPGEIHNRTARASGQPFDPPRAALIMEAVGEINARAGRTL
jgi:hypothetical protein